MFVHIALFKWKPGTEEHEIESVLKKLEALHDKIPGILEISTGENQSHYSEGYTHIVFVRGDDKDAIEAYRMHPDHQALADQIEAMEEHGIGIDFETSD